MTRSENLTEIIGGRIADLRTARRLTQKQLADIVGVRRASIGHYEEGKNKPSFEVLFQLANFFGVTVDYLMGITDLPYAPQEIDLHSIAGKPLSGFLKRIENMTLEQQNALLDLTEIVEKDETDTFCELLKLYQKIHG